MLGLDRYMKTSKNKGFTLLEILLVIAAIGILASIVLVAINPNRQLAQARNLVRQADINTIQKALEQYLIDNRDYPAGIDGTPRDICINGNTANCVNLGEGILVPTYLAAIPVDPQGGAYRVSINLNNNRIAVTAPSAELGQDIAINVGTYATGGDSVYTINVSGITYRVHEFRTVGNSTLNVLSGGNFEYLVVAGGGGGGRGQFGSGGGGGGAGGFREGTLVIEPNSYSVIVGGGGNERSNGFPSSIFNIESAGGGRGGDSQSPGTGGSGGGAKRDGGTGASGNTPSVSPVQGYNGGSTPFGGWIGGAGGGGAGGIGLNGGGGGSSSEFAGPGGPGKESLITGTSVFYAGGGGGANEGNSATDKRGHGGIGGGGTGSASNGSIAATSGSSNTGGGGGAHGYGVGTLQPAGSGGSGIVIVRYLIP
jgi:prepilin-type N-terminal cleavage/methylation domain-containing protein